MQKHIIMEKEKSIEKIPMWSLRYTINGDATGLTDEEIRMIDNLFNQWKVELISSITENNEVYPYFLQSVYLRLYRCHHHKNE